MSRQADILRPVIRRAAFRPHALRFFRTLLQFLKACIAGLLMAAPSWAAETLVTSTRVWPAPDYTRVTIESQQPVKHTLFSLDNPDRLVLDLEDVALGATLNDIAGKISAEDPYIKGVRVGRFKPGTVRLVFDLKATITPEVFSLAPIGEYGHRLVLDVYPLEPPDPLLAFLRNREHRHAEAPAAVPAPDAPVPPVAGSKPPATAKPAPRAPRPPSERLITIVIDAGPGGEDPGA
ncbi:MAG: AMIN domain-containing protein, partial [Burkholderiales bacterium]|nr:AMIN domain-containing protein [Burkholderiales bacterium]